MGIIIFKIFIFGRYTVLCMVGNHILWLHSHVTIKAPVTLSRFKPRFTTTHPDLRQMVKSGCIGMRRDGKKEIPASIRCLTMLLRCQHDSSTDLLRLMTAALRFTTVELRMLTNAHDASTIRYGASTIQAGSATVASRPPTNLNDLVVVMRKS